MSVVRSLDVAIRANTGNFEGGMRNVSRALKATIVGMNAVAAAAAGQEKSFIGMINAVAIGFATGGPWGAAIASAGVAVGVLIGKVKAGAEEWKKSMESMRAETAKFAKEMEGLKDKVFEAGGGFLPARRIERLDAQIAAMKEAIKLADEAAAAAHPLISAGPNAPAWLADLLATDAAKSAARLREELGETQMQRFFSVGLGQGDLLLMADAATKEAELLSITDDRERAIAKIRMDTQETLDFMAQMKALGVAAPGHFGNWEAMESVFVRLEGLKIDAVPRALQKTSEAAQVAARSVSDFLSAVIVRGAQAKDVLLSIAQTLVSMGIQRGVNAAFGLATP